jgi:hypothetical protein
MSFLSSRVVRVAVVLCIFLLAVTMILKFTFVEEAKLLGFEPEKRDKILFPFGYFKYDIKKYVNKANKEELKDPEYPNPWMTSQNFISSLRQYALNKSFKIDQTLKEIDAIMAYFVKNGYIFPRPQYKEYEKGWTSCMDALPIAVSCQLAWEVTGDSKYKKYRDTLIHYGVKKPIEPSFILRFPDGKTWLSEYASVNPKERIEKEYYVLNGYLIGLHSLKILSYVTGDKSLEKLYISSLAKYKELADQFYFKNGEWCYYMLCPRTINQIHYVIFETVELDALHSLTEDPFFAEQAQKRRNFLSNVLSPSFQIQGGEIKWGILRAAAPHPYYIDTYPMEIRFYDSEKKRCTGTFLSEDNSFADASFMGGKVPPESLYFRVYGYPNNDSDGIYYFEGSIPSHIVAQPKPDMKSQPGISYSTDFSFAASATGQDEGLVTWGDSNKARITFRFDTPLEVDLFTYWGVPIFSEGETSVSIALVDGHGRNVSRYYLPIKRGYNFILLHYLGFRNLDILDLKDVRQVIIILTKNLDSKEHFAIKIGEFHVLKNAFEVSNFLKLHPYTNKLYPTLNQE